MTDSPGIDRSPDPGRSAAASPILSIVPRILVGFAMVMAVLFLLLGFIVFVGGWASIADTQDDVWLQLLAVGQGALPYFIASGVFWLLAEYKTIHGD